MDIEKTRMLACESIYQINMNTDIEIAIKTTLHALITRPHDPRT